MERHRVYPFRQRFGENSGGLLSSFSKTRAYWGEVDCR